MEVYQLPFSTTLFVYISVICFFMIVNSNTLDLLKTLTNNYKPIFKDQIETFYFIGISLTITVIISVCFFYGTLQFEEAKSRIAFSLMFYKSQDIINQFSNLISFSFALLTYHLYGIKKEYSFNKIFGWSI